MGTFRLYAGADQQAHIETIDLKAKPDWLKGLAASQISFREWPAGQFLDWHPAPRRQFMTCIAGAWETVDGTQQARRFKTGDVLLLEDTVGAGHLTRIIGDTDCLVQITVMPSEGER